MLRNMVKEAAAAPGTGTTVTLSGAQAGFTSFATAFGNGATAYYIVTDGTQSEFQSGTVTVGSPNTLSRGTPIWTSTGSASRLNFTASCTVYCAVPASRSPYFNASDVLDLGSRRVAGLAAQGTTATADEAARLDSVGWRAINTTVVAAATSGVSWALPSGYQRFRIQYDEVFVTGSGSLFLRWSLDNMATVLSTANEYRGGGVIGRTTGVSAWSETADYLRITLSSPSSMMGEVEFYPAGAKFVSFRTSQYDSSSVWTMFQGAGVCATNAATPTHVFVGGVGSTISQGRFKLLGQPL